MTLRYIGRQKVETGWQSSKSFKSTTCLLPAVAGFRLKSPLINLWKPSCTLAKYRFAFGALSVARSRLGVGPTLVLSPAWCIQYLHISNMQRLHANMLRIYSTTTSIVHAHASSFISAITVYATNRPSKLPLAQKHLELGFIPALEHHMPVDLVDLTVLRWQPERLYDLVS